MQDSILNRAQEPGFAAPRSVLVAGASGGIGHAFCDELSQRYPSSQIIRLARDLCRLKPLSRQTTDISFDLLDEASVSSALEQLPAAQSIDMALLATGWLHDEKYKPEKTYKSLHMDHMIHAFTINAIAPALFIKQLIPRMSRDILSRIGVLSARVGSISDNRLGGWHSYRASKAALNMLIKNFAIEMNFKRESLAIVGLQPGTTDTPLSAPYQRNVPKSQLQSPAFTASHLVDVMERVNYGDSGKLYDFLGVPFEP